MQASDIWVEHNATQTLTNLIIIHKEHDRIYHRDIFSMEVDRKLAHLTLHLTKYTGRGIERILNGTWLPGKITVDEEVRLVVDALSVLLSLCGVVREVSLAGISEDVDLKTTNYWFRMAVLNGDLAKAVESRDHLEPLNARAVILTTIQRMLHLTLGVLSKGRKYAGVVDEYVARVREIESKSPLQQQVHGTIDNGYRREYAEH